MNNDEEYGDPFEAESEDTTLVTTRHSVPAVQPQPVISVRPKRAITVRQAALPSSRGGTGLMAILKPDGRHYSRKVLAGIGMLVLFACVGLLVMRAVLRRLTPPAEEKVVSIEEAIGRGNRGAQAGVALSAGGHRRERNGTVMTGKHHRAFKMKANRGGAALATYQPRDMEAESIPRDRARARRRAIAIGILNGTVETHAAPTTEDKERSSAFSVAWAKAMAATLPALAGGSVNSASETAKTEDATPVAERKPLPVVAPVRNTTLALTLLEPVTSGIAAPVRARVSVDVKDARGNVIIPHGSIATVPFLAVEVHGRIPQDRQAPIVITLPSGAEMTFHGLVRGRDGLPGLTGKVSKGQGGPGFFKRVLGLGGRAASVGLSATGMGGMVNSSDLSGLAGVDPYGSVGRSSEREVKAPAGSVITIIVGL